MNTLEILIGFASLGVTLAGSIVSGIVWLARLGAQVKFLEQRHDECLAIRTAYETTVSLQLKQMNDMLIALVTDVRWLRDKKGDSNGTTKKATEGASA
jgi:hypothetical protein